MRHIQLTFVILLCCLTMTAQTFEGTVDTTVDASTTITLSSTYTRTLQYYASGVSYRWYSSNTSVASVSYSSYKSCTVRGNAKGTCRVYFEASYYVDGNRRSFYFYWDVTVSGVADGLTVINPISAEIIPTELTLDVGQTYNMSYKVYPTNADYWVDWESKRGTIASVISITGRVKAESPGETEILMKVHRDDGVCNIVESCKVTVNSIKVSSIQLSEDSISLEKGSSAQLLCTVLPEDATYKTLSFASTDESVATIDVEGSIMAIGAGDCDITAATTDGSDIQSVCHIQVSEKAEDIIVFADAKAKYICIQDCDTDGDGELSKAEAAAVTGLGEMFWDQSEVRSFDELQYFTGLSSIGYEAFSGCSSLSSTVIPNSVTSIGTSAFIGCSNLPAITIPKSVTSIGDGIFQGCSALTSIVVENGNTVYDSRDNCNAIIETSSNKLIAGCKTTIIPSSVTVIGKYACQSSGLASVVLPNSVVTIMGCAFRRCYNLTTVEIPGSVISINDRAFAECTSLREVYCYIEEPFAINSSVFSYLPADATLYVPAGTKSKYESTNGWSAFKYIVEMGSGESYSAIAPMVTASWHQKSPFNDACPDGAAAGCGAVAVAQILNYYKKPEHGYGHAAYNSEDVDFEANPIAWGNIRDVYGTGSTDAERAAVAQLVHQVGVAMKMQYGSSSSPANRASMMWGLQHYLHFSPQSRYRYRRYYSTEEWLRMLDNELEAKRPVVYRGDHSSFEKALAGHIFVIDGRDSGKRYHFNFGHASSTQDKYASLNIINQGTENFIGRKSNGSDNAAYDYCQAMITSFFPVDSLTDADYDAANIMITKPMVIGGDRTPRTVSMTGSVTISFQFHYVSFTAGSIQYSIGFYQNGQLKGVSTTTRTATLSDGGRGILANNYSFALPTGLTNGDYEMAVVTRTDSSAPWLRGWDCAPNSIPVTVDGGTFTFSVPSFHDGEANLKLEALPMIVGDGVIEFTVVNTSENNFEGTIKVTCGDTENSLLTAVYEGQSVTYRFPVGSNSIDGVSISYLADGSEQWQTLNSTEYLPGDINLDGEVDGTDLVLLTNMIMTNDSSNEIADMNGDNEVDGTDYVLMVNKIMGFSNARRETAEPNADIANTRITAEPIAVRPGESTTLTIAMDNPGQAVTLVQMDVTLPKGLTLGGEDNFDNMDNRSVMMAERTSWHNHTLMANNRGNRMRLLLASATNQVIERAEGGIIRLTLKAGEDFSGGDIVLSNIICASPDAATARPNDYVLHLGGEATGMAEIADGTSNKKVAAYDLSGRRISTSLKQKEVYIVGGRKVVK